MTKKYTPMICLAIFLAVFLPFLANGQTKPFTREFYLGAKGGVVFSRVKFKPNVEQDFFMGNTAGLIFRMISEPHVGIQFEFNYLQDGWQEKMVEGMNQSYYHKLNYFEIPIMTHANLGKKAFRFTFNVGPSVAFLHSESQGMNPSTPEIPAEPVVTYWGKPIDTQISFLFVGGLGSEYHFRKIGALALDARVFYSLTSIYDPSIYRYDPSQPNGFQVTLSYLFRLNKARN